MRNQSAYSEKLRQAGLEILQFEGFNGKDADNLRIIGNACNLLVITQLLKGKTATKTQCAGPVARPERFELPTAWFVARYSIQLSYGRE